MRFLKRFIRWIRQSDRIERLERENRLWSAWVAHGVDKENLEIAIKDVAEIWSRK